ncbi:Na+/H+ antiporter NhaD/arsenite permease-like protein [Providencia alcalifaciens]|nr:Na+/H+ antiporter NhaD/arsenite permease-like protein [Providencia alcalifaciens]
MLLLIVFFALEPLGIPVSAIAAFILWLIVAKGKVINTEKVLRGAPW